MESATLLVNEIYKSIQGETSFVGLPFVLVRLTGCGLRCSYCDTEYAFYEGKNRLISEILHTVESLKIRHVLVTGGEPLDQKACKTLIARLLDLGHEVLVETSGTHCIRDCPRGAHYIVDVKTPSSKMAHKNYPNMVEDLSAHDELKFVIGTREDYEFSKAFVKRQPLICPVLFSPVFGKMEYKTLVGWILEDALNVRFQIQLHKHVWDPNLRGV
jgi:7-carboxy-7-deazaguanine synthase